jgi:tripartite-type tricarboxylate transporter receptor subunit TctC
MQHRRPLLSLVALVYAGAALLLGASAAAPAAEPDAFYKGKTISIYIGFAAGGSYDYFGRLASRHLGKHLRGIDAGRRQLHRRQLSLRPRRP